MKLNELREMSAALTAMSAEATIKDQTYFNRYDMAYDAYKVAVQEWATAHMGETLRWREAPYQAVRSGRIVGPSWGAAIDVDDPAVIGIGTVMVQDIIS